MTLAALERHFEGVRRSLFGWRHTIPWSLVRSSGSQEAQALDVRSALDGRLLAAGFEGVRTATQAGLAVYQLSSREATKFGAVKTLVAIYDVPSGATVADFMAHSSTAFGDCQQLTRSGAEKPNYLLVYTVALSPRSPITDEFIQRFRPSHWKAREFPVVVDPGTGELVLNAKKPIWGAAYYGGHVAKAEALFKLAG